MDCDCGKPKCDGHCGVSPAVLQINNPSECVLFRKVEVPASMGTSVENPPKTGAYRNVLLYYKADGEAYLYSSDGIPTKVTGTTSNYEILTNKPKINGVELVGDKSLADIGVTNAINNALEPYTPTSGFADVAFSGSYTDLTDKPDIPSGLHVFYMGPASVGDTAPIYHDYEKTNQVTLAQFIDAIASGPVQIYKAYDTRSFLIYYVDPIDAFIPDPPQYIGTLYANFGLRDPYGLGVKRFSWYEPDTAPTYDSYDPNQSDWNETSSTNSSYIKNKPNLATVATSGSYNDLSNKPTIPAAQVNSDWNASSGVAQILNKPTLAAVATSGNYDDLSNKPTIPAAQVNSDWNAASGVAQILNKPSLATVATSGSYNDLTDKPADFELVEMSYGESNAWAKFIAAYQGHKIVYCRVSSNADPSTGTQGRKAFMAYVNNAENPTEVEFQYVRSVASKTASQPVDQVFVYKLTNTNGGTWTVETRNMAPKLAAGTNATVSYSNGTYTVGATVPTKTSDLTNDGATGASVYVEESDIAPSELSGEGELVTLEGTTDCSALDTQLLGNAEQTGTPAPDSPQPISTVTGEQTVTVTGKNLLDMDDFLTAAEATYTKNGGQYSITAWGNLISIRYPLQSVKAGNTYTISLDGVAQNTTSTRLQVYKNGSVVGTIYGGTDHQEHSYTFTADGSQYELNATYSSPFSSPVIFKNPQLELGSATAYEPYQGQNYEVNLGKNLYSETWENGGISASTGENNSDANIRTVNYVSVLASTTYTASCDTGTRIALRFYNSVGTFLGAGTTSSANVNTFTTPANTARVRFVVIGASGVTPNFQLELGSTATSYAPYFTPIELAGVGEIQPDGLPEYHDTIKPIDGKWYIEKNVGKVVLNGSENWSLYPNKTHTFRVGAPHTIVNAICDHFTSIPSSQFDVNAGAYTTNTGIFIISYPDMADVASFKTWLANNPTTFYCAGAQWATTTEITNEALIGQLEALAGALGYDGVTNIISTSPGLPAILSVSTYTGSAIPPATRARAGIVRIGDGIDVDDCGTISVNAQKAPTAFTMQYADNLAGWQSGDNYELVKETTGTPTDYIYRANKFYYGGADVSFLNEKTGVVFTPQELYAWLLDGNEAVLNHVPLGWTVNNDAEVLYTGNYIDGIWLKKETRTSQSGNTISFNGSAFVTASISRASGYERVQDTLGITISGYEDDGAMVYDLISIDGFSLYGSVQESSPII